MCLVSRITHILAKPGVLHHEAYMSTYAYLVSACILPLFIITNLKRQAAKRADLTEEDSYPNHVKVIGVCILFLIMLFKNFYLDRVQMKRFVRDYDLEKHEKFPSWRLGGNNSSEVVAI